MTKLLVLYYSSYGHIETMAEAVAEGARQVAGVEVTVKRVPELVPEDVEIPVALIHGHVHAVLAMVREEAGGDDNTTAVALANVLRQATSHWLESKGLDRQPEPVAQAG